MFTHTLYMIENLTHMHVGSGDANFGTVDRLIQRDAVTDYPSIHASSLKGALKEYCEYRNQGDENTADTFIAQTFGSDDTAGNLRFVEAQLLCVPMRSDTRPYYLCTSPMALSQFLECAETFGITLPDADALVKAANYKGKTIAIADEKAQIEECAAKGADGIDFNALENLLGGPAALVPDELFSQLLRDLPVIARNQLDNGESKNLWYEEVLPRKSRLYTVVGEPDYVNENDEDLKKHFQRFHRYLTDGTPIQIGANASVGYGLCRFREVSRG